MITIQNEHLKVNINENGGSMTSIQKDGIEYQWQGDKDSWLGQDVVIFPFVARLKDQKYTVDGVEYSMKSHGLCRYSTLMVEAKKEDMVILSLTWSESTLLQYPYKFKFFATYELIDNELKVSYKVVNIDEKAIYFGIGGHPALKLPLKREEGEDNIDGNSIEFEYEIEPNNYSLNKDGCFITGKEKFGKIKKLDLSKNLFRKYKTLLLTDVYMNNLTLHRCDGVDIKMKVNNPKVLAIWSNENYGAYICIEPWHGIPDLEERNLELKDKELINRLDKNMEFDMSYSIII